LNPEAQIATKHFPSVIGLALAAVDRQIAENESAIREGQMNPTRLANLEKTLEQLKAEQRHLVFWSDRKLDSLGVGLCNLDNGSGYLPQSRK
jgi:4-hydroxyphenylpyruvate dioxygenase-like putative hemolysin